MKVPPIEISFSQEFLAKYEGKNPFQNPLSQFVYLRTYCRWLEDKKRRETWVETCIRCIKYSFSLYRGPEKAEELQAQAEQMFDDMFKIGQTPSGRTMWVGGTEVIESIPTANYNCAFTNIDSLESIRDLFYLLMVGTGVGFSTEKEVINKLPLFRNNVKVEFEEYNWCGTPGRVDETHWNTSGPSKNMVVGDSREGWSNGLLEFLQTLSKESYIEYILVNTDEVRPANSRLVKFGGKSSGPEPYCNMLKKIHEVICNAPEVSSGLVRLRPIDVLDICNIIGENVVAGGVRRTAELAIMDADDEEVIGAKYHFWDKPGKGHRAMSNNSIAFWEKPTIEYLKSLIPTIRECYEPGFVNMAAASLRRPNFAGFNPCVEILLANKAFCNLVTIFVLTCLRKSENFSYIDMDELIRLGKSGTRHALRITNTDIELPEWDENQKRDRLLGVNLTGTEDAFDAAYTGREALFGDDKRIITVSLCGKILEISVDEFKRLLNEEYNQEAKDYAFEMRVPTPLLVCTVQPGGTGSQLNSSGPCSPGFHKSFAPYFIRRVRINSADALAQTVLTQGYRVFPEVGNGFSSAEYLELSPENKLRALAGCRTWVVEFAVKSEAKVKAEDESAISQLNRYFSYQNNYTDHNTSATIQVGDDEWEQVMEYLHRRWDEYIGVSFQNKSNDKYDLAPYEAITEEEYYIRLKQCPLIDTDLMNAIENGRNSADDDLDGGCASGACPVR